MESVTGEVASSPPTRQLCWSSRNLAGRPTLELAHRQHLSRVGNVFAEEGALHAETVRGRLEDGESSHAHATPSQAYSIAIDVRSAHDRSMTKLPMRHRRLPPRPR
jgi:hypothetical protein